ncbi:PAS domain S-box protein [Phenylobacterium sp.]|uniref:hybrid sensor histidine kinase/response regulator n=1 Tax=Phenylobacterium sp. TaxID=1871053 RepID=UPI002EDB74E3
MTMTENTAPASSRGGQGAPGLAEDMRRAIDLFADAPGGMIVTAGPEHRIAMLNAAYSAWIEHRDVVGLTVTEAFPNLEELGFQRLLDKVYATGRTQVIRATRTLIQRPDGLPPREAYVNFVLQPIRDASGVVCGIFSQGHDVTKEKLAEQELRASQAQLRAALATTQTILDNSHDVICTLDVQGRFLQVSRQSERMWGYRPDEMVGKSYLDLVHPDDIVATAEHAMQLARGPSSTFMNRYRHRDGSIVPVMWSAVWSRDHQTTFAIGRDMRDHVAAEEKLRQAQKMEVVGRLAGGIAHDFNNLLTVVIGATETLAEALADRSDLAPVADVALEAAQRGAELVSQLMAVSRTQSLAPQTINCNRFLEGLLPMLKRTLGGQIEVWMTPAASDICCLADLTQLTSAMLNLCINARDAMPEGGRLTLGAATAPGDDGPVVFSVADTGEGMSPAVRARALEPFFTTKPEGKGSGLGLSMVCGFAEQSGGRLEIDTAEGAGTTVSVSLPRTRPCAETPRAHAEVADLPCGLRVLLVEDDDQVRGQVRRQLEALGCAVTDCACGHDALDVIAGGVAVDLMMTDINMPGGLNGRQLADHARLLDPALRILFSSGHTEDPVLRTAGRDPRSAFLAKPYRRAELAAKLAGLIGQTA